MPKVFQTPDSSESESTNSAQRGDLRPPGSEGRDENDAFAPSSARHRGEMPDDRSHACMGIVRAYQRSRTDSRTVPYGLRSQRSEWRSRRRRHSGENRRAEPDTQGPWHFGDTEPARNITTSTLPPSAPIGASFWQKCLISATRITLNVAHWSGATGCVSQAPHEWEDAQVRGAGSRLTEVCRWSCNSSSRRRPSSSAAARSFSLRNAE